MVPKKIIQQWRTWAELEIAGSQERIEVATRAAVAVMDAGENNPDRIAQAARSAALQWDSQHREQERKNDLPAPARGLIRGRASTVQLRTELRRVSIAGPAPPHILIYDFRLDRLGTDGSPVPAIAVEFRSPGSFFSTSKGFEGSILEGDEVEINANKYKPGTTFQVDQVHNLSSNSIVRIRGSSPAKIFRDSTTEKYSVIRGFVTAKQQVQDVSQMGLMVWSFRLQRIGPEGSSLPTVEVEIRSRGFEGAIADGDEVELDARGYRAGDIVSVKQVRNITSNSVVRARK